MMKKITQFLAEAGVWELLEKNLAVDTSGSKHLFPDVTGEKVLTSIKLNFEGRDGVIIDHPLVVEQVHKSLQDLATSYLKKVREEAAKSLRTGNDPKPVYVSKTPVEQVELTEFIPVEKKKRSHKKKSKVEGTLSTKVIPPTEVKADETLSTKVIPPTEVKAEAEKGTTNPVTIIFLGYEKGGRDEIAEALGMPSLLKECGIRSIVHDETPNIEYPVNTVRILKDIPASKWKDYGENVVTVIVSGLEPTPPEVATELLEKYMDEPNASADLMFHTSSALISSESYPRTIYAKANLLKI